MSEEILQRIAPDDVPGLRRDPVDASTLSAAAAIVDDVRDRGVEALRHHAEKYGDVEEGGAMVVTPERCRQAYESLDADDRALLERTRDRIAAFAQAQRDSLSDLTVEIPGGEAGHDIAPMEVAGCYAPGGRFPLPSSVLMTAVTARVAGVETVWVASPKPTDVTLAAAHVAGADAVLAVGGAQAIAALAYGAGEVPACDVIVGPGNRWVTAAKQLVAGSVAIDMLAGPSELVVLADHTASVDVVAADLLAQAEHDPDAVPILVTTSSELAEEIEAELARQLEDLPTASTATAALTNGFVTVVDSVAEGIAVCDRIAPEHLEVITENASEVGERLSHYGGLFVGGAAAEVLGDYGAGPNHVLPTGGTARSTGGLSVMTFLRVRTWMRIDDVRGARQLVDDAADLARHEGLEAHARSAEKRSE